MGQDRALEHASDRHRCGWTMRRTPMALPLDWPKTERSEVPLSQGLIQAWSMDHLKTPVSAIT